MTTISCAGCGEYFDRKLSACPNCGHKRKRRSIVWTCSCVVLTTYFALVVVNILILPLFVPRYNADASLAVGYLRTIVGAQIAYHEANSRYATTFKELTDSKPPYLDEHWPAIHNHYHYVLAGDGSTFSVTATPTPDADNEKSFFTDETGIIRFSDSGPANRKATPIGD